MVFSFTDLVIVALRFPGDFTQGGESGAVRRGGAEEGMGNPFGLLSTSMLLPQFETGGPAMTSSSSVRFGSEATRCRKKNKALESKELISPTSCVTLIKSSNLSEPIYEIRLMAPTLKVIEKTK